MSDGPKRLLEEAGASSEDVLLGKMLRSAQEDLPDEALLSRIEAKLPSGSGAPTPPTGSGGATGSATGSGAALSNTGLWMKLAGILFATVAVIAIATRDGPPEPSAVEPIAEPIEEPIEKYGPPWSGSRDAPESATPVAPVERRPAPKKPRSKAKRRTPKPPVSREAELPLIKAAQAALVKGEHRRALSLTEKHRAQHPRGAFVQEREVIAISALLRAERREDAEKRVAAFERAFPRSAHLRRLKVLLQKP